MLTLHQVGDILDSVFHAFTLGSQIEFTFEVNPEDINRRYLTGLKDLGINRLSIGVQSFNESDLQFMNRAHSAAQAIEAVKLTQDVGFASFSIDLMFGLIGSENAYWLKNLEDVVNMQIPHISCYNLTIEEQTVFSNWLRKKKIRLPREEDQIEQFLQTHEILGSAGYLHYEVSNYAVPGHESFHNSNYWKGKPYIGIGPSAHSYSDGNRFWNVSNNARYITHVSNGEKYWELEELSESNRYNELIMLRLRTSHGLSKKAIAIFSDEIQDHFNRAKTTLISQDLLAENDEAYYIPLKNLVLSDSISSDLFFVS